MFGKNKKIAELEKRVEALENIISSLSQKESAQSPLGETEGKKNLSYKETMDEWLNGKKEGAGK